MPILIKHNVSKRQIEILFSLMFVFCMYTQSTVDISYKDFDINVRSCFAMYTVCGHAHLYVAMVGSHWSFMGC